MGGLAHPSRAQQDRASHIVSGRRRPSAPDAGYLNKHRSMLSHTSRLRADVVVAITPSAIAPNLPHSTTTHDDSIVMFIFTPLSTDASAQEN